MDAALKRGADIVGAGVVVITVERDPDAENVLALIVLCARIAVITGLKGRGVLAASVSEALIERALIVVIAVHGLADADALKTTIRARTQALGSRF